MFVKVTNGAAEKYTLGQLRRDNPNVSFPKTIPEETLADYDVYPCIDTPQTAFNPTTQRISEAYTTSNGAWYRVWEVTDRDAEEVVPLLYNQIASDRYEKESSGVIWSDADEITWFIDTSVESQNRLSSAVSSAQNGIRQDGGKWKLAKVVNGQTSLSYRPTTNAELIQWGQVVHNHVQKCFEAEANAVEKVNAGDYTATFETEYNLL